MKDNSDIAVLNSQIATLKEYILELSAIIKAKDDLIQRLQLDASCHASEMQNCKVMNSNVLEMY